LADVDDRLARPDQCNECRSLECAAYPRFALIRAFPAKSPDPMNKAKAAAIIQEQFDRQTRESFGNVELPGSLAVDLVRATSRSAGAIFTRRHGVAPEPFTLAAMALMHGAMTPEFATSPPVQAYFVRALFQMSRDLDAIKLDKVNRDIIDATLDAASDLAPHWFPRKR
jgi:hypothetical protein